jgi:hypothetical protein
VVSKLDRLARSVHDFAGLVRLAEKEGWGIVALDLGVDMTTPTGGLLANVTASVAEWERKIISLRTTEALAQRRLEGVRLGRPRILDPQIAIRIRARRATGVTLQDIADELNSERTRTATGRMWSPRPSGRSSSKADLHRAALKEVGYLGRVLLLAVQVLRSAGRDYRTIELCPGHVTVVGGITKGEHLAQRVGDPVSGTVICGEDSGCRVETAGSACGRSTKGLGVPIRKYPAVRVEEPITMSAPGRDS